MKILFCGDTVGRAGRNAISTYISELKRKHSLDFIVVNGENAASGFGITKKICDSYISSGVDVITGGDHCFDQKETMHFIGDYEKLLRMANLPDRLPGRGYDVFRTSSNQNILVIHLQTQIFMKLNVDCPFACVDKILQQYELGKNVHAILVDVHGEASSERMALGHYLDGRVSMVVGSHTHVPTADAQILPRGTAYQTDAGMCGDYDSVIGFAKELSVMTYLNKVRTEKAEVAGGEPTLCGVFVETDDKTGLAREIKPVRVGGRLDESLPEN